MVNLLQQTKFFNVSIRHRDLTAGVTGVTAVAPKFSDALTLFQSRGADSAKHCSAVVAPKFFSWLNLWSTTRNMYLGSGLKERPFLTFYIPLFSKKLSVQCIACFEANHYWFKAYLYQKKPKLPAFSLRINISIIYHLNFLSSDSFHEFWNYKSTIFFSWN